MVDLLKRQVAVHRIHFPTKVVSPGEEFDCPWEFLDGLRDAGACRDPGSVNETPAPEPFPPARMPRGTHIGLTLRELKGKLYKHPVIEADGHEYWHRVETIEEAYGVQFLCPVCYIANGGARGTHGIICWDPRVSQDHPPNPGRWWLRGTGLDDLSLVHDSSSVALTGESGCKAHFFVSFGKIAKSKAHLPG